MFRMTLTFALSFTLLAAAVAVTGCSGKKSEPDSSKSDLDGLFEIVSRVVADERAFQAAMAH